MRLLRPSPRLAALVFFGFALAGCGPGGAWALAAIAVLLLALAGCSESRVLGPDAGPRADAGTADAGRLIDGGGFDAGEGHWESCCEAGRAATCLCPAGASCNYGLGLVICDDGTCDYGVDPDVFCAADAGAPDAGDVDAGGTWEPCCVEERIETCFCPAGVACNYGLYQDCGGGVCVFPGEPCPADS